MKRSTMISSFALVGALAVGGGLLASVTEAVAKVRALLDALPKGRALGSA